MRIKKQIAALGLVRFSFALCLVLSYVITNAGANTEARMPMDWSLQPGESVRDLARLIYPKNVQMQQYFIAETIRLNHEAQPDLHPGTVFSQPNQIRIPSIHGLSAKSGLKKSKR